MRMIRLPSGPDVDDDEKGRRKSFSKVLSTAHSRDSQVG